MGMTRKIASIVVTACMIATLGTGCGSTGASVPASTTAGSAASASSSAAASESQAAAQEMIDLNVAFISGSSLPDLSKVQDAINEITKSEIQANVTWKLYSFSNYTEQMNLLLASNSEAIDLMPVFSGDYTNYVSTGKLLDMTDALAAYGQGIREQVGADYLPAGQVGGRQFGVPAIMGWPSSTAVVMRKDILDKAGVSLDSVKKLADLTPILEKVHASSPEGACLVPESTKMLDNYITYDALGDKNGVLLNYGSELKVTNWFESAEYAEMVRLMRSWNQAGYIMADAEISQDVGNTLIKNQAGYGLIRGGSPGAAESVTMASGYEMVQVNICDALSTTSQVGVLEWVVPIIATDINRSVQMLNLMYSDERVANLIAWGIEGTHYVKKTDGTIGYPEGVTAETASYMPNTAWEMGNQFITHVWEGNSADYNEQLKAFNRDANVSKAMGFAWSSTNVTTAISAVTNVCDQYRPALESGAVDPEKALPEFIQALKDAGIDQIIAEKQTQLDAWASKNNIQ